MGISEKIEEIRNKPDDIKLRYIWGAVLISMLVIIAIWVLSLSASLKENKINKDTLKIDELKNEIESVKKTAPSLEDLSKNYPEMGI
jgi:Tfp pilus assembly protein PilO